jgi:hypothetical protein
MGPSPTYQTHASALMDVSPDHAAYPYRTGHGRPLEPPTNSSTRNPQSATRPMGVAETSPSVPRRDGEGALKKTSRRALPDRLERAQARWLDARLHLLDCTHRGKCQQCVRHRSWLKQCRRRLKYAPHPLIKSRGKTPTGAPTLLQGFGARPAGPLTRPQGKHSQARREGRPISGLQHLREPCRRTRRCSGATVGDSPRGPLKQQGKPHLKPVKSQG